MNHLPPAGRKSCWAWAVDILLIVVPIIALALYLIWDRTS